MSMSQISDGLGLLARQKTKEEWEPLIDYMFPKEKKHDVDMLERYKRFKKGAKSGD